MNEAFKTSLKIGILGGGQLGRMIYQEAIDFGLHLHFLDVKGSPCQKISPNFSEGNIRDYDDVIAFGKSMDILTIEIENVNVDALFELEKQGVKVFPEPRVILLIQDKGLQKEFFRKINVPTANYELLEDREDLKSNSDKLPAMLKLRKGGYDGKGVIAIIKQEDIEAAFDEPCVLEQFVDMDKELSVIVARNENGEMITYPCVEQEFNSEANLVEFLFSPSDAPTSIQDQAKEIAKKIISELDMTGILAVEFFLSKGGALFVNEIAPRPHNSGHQTIEGNYTSQFEQHLRSITNMSLGGTDLIMPSVMVNLLGEKESFGSPEYKNLDDWLKISGVYPHIYGKEQTKPFRKMGHITVINHDLERAKTIARQLVESIQVIGK